MNPSLDDSVVIVTGASSGIGKATAEACVRRGATVALAARDAQRLSALAQQLGGPSHALALPTDVTRSEDCERLARLTAEKFGRIDVLINNAGIGHWARFDELSEADVRRLLDVNVLGVMNMARAVSPWMRKQQSGVIINIASVIAYMGIPMMSVYCAAKFAVRGFSQSLRLELAKDNISVVTVSPGTTHTEFFDRAIRGNKPWAHGLAGAMSPEKVAETIVEAAERPCAEVVLTSEGKALALAARHFPRLTEWAVKRFLKF